MRIEIPNLESDCDNTGGLKGESNESREALQSVASALSGVLGRDVESILAQVHNNLGNALLLCSTTEGKIRIVRKTAGMDKQLLEDKIADRYAAGAEKVVVLEVF